MTGQRRDALADGFVADLLTDWVPDAIGAVDAIRALRETPAPPATPVATDEITVQMARRSERLAIIDVMLRARLHWLVDEALTDHLPAPGVFSYRSGHSGYHTGYWQRAARLRELSSDQRYPLVLYADVHHFSASVSLETLLRQPWMTSVLAAELSAINVVAGHCCLRGHLWANRLCGTVLEPLDAALEQAVGSRWVRWSDDIHVFVTDDDEAQRVRQLIAEELSNQGLRLSDAKTGVGPATWPLAGPARNVAGRPAEVWRAGVEHNDMRALRFALPRLGPLGDPVALRDLLAVTAAHPYLLPRAISYLDHFAETTEGVEIFHQWLERELVEPWPLARLLALAIRHPALLSALPEHTVRAAAYSDVAGVRALAWRAAFEQGRVTPAPTARLSSWMRDNGWLNACGTDLPSVKSLL
ncbi:hypothetical protein ACIBKY_28990 [Nonomuraea sp. NPDC050394]|uniref:hypothetical protein n=1 Tax=Nonomuraea sp. NPDC050394 TaxID=3364363 RepID=UPI0037987AE9